MNDSVEVFSTMNTVELVATLMIIKEEKNLG